MSEVTYWRCPECLSLVSNSRTDCPACDSHVFVDGTDYAAGRYY